MIPMKYWIKRVLSVDDYTDEFNKMKNKTDGAQVIKATMEVNCFGTESIETRYFYAKEWENIRRVGCFIG